MEEQSNDLMIYTGYPLVEQNGQRKFGPPPEWTGPPPQKGCEVFVKRLPKMIFEDELVPIFGNCGKIYEMRLMMAFSGFNRGYAFVNYTNREDAFRAIQELHGFEIRQGWNICVVKSVDNCCLYLSRIPKDRTKEELFEQLSVRVSDIVEVVMLKNGYDQRLNKGFAFVEFTSHGAAATAKRALAPVYFRLWDRSVYVNWADPEPDIDDVQMKKVKVLFVRNLLIRTPCSMIKIVFEASINNQLKRIKKIGDYAFIHFYDRKHAELAMAKLQSAEIDGSNIEIKWAKPVNSLLYKIQKKGKGNAKFNITNELAHTTRHANMMTMMMLQQSGANASCILAPPKLDEVCKRYMWAAPVYEYAMYLDPRGFEIWVGKVELPLVGLPLLNVPRRIGPLITTTCYSMQQAMSQAAASALDIIRKLLTDQLQ